MKRHMAMYPVIWMWTTVLRLLEVVGMVMLIFVLFLAGVIEASDEHDEPE